MSILRLSEDLVNLICLRIMHVDPTKMLMLIRALRLKQNEDFWESAWKLHIDLTEAGVLSIRYFMSQYYFGRVNRKTYERIFTLTYEYKCELCGRGDSHLDDYLKKHLCLICKQDNYISNYELYYDYGLSAHDIVHSWGRFVRYYPLRKFGANNALEFMMRSVRHSPYTQIMFFWQPDIAKCYNLPRLRQCQAKRVAGARLMTAVFKRLFARNRSHYELRINEFQRLSKPYWDSKWFPGSNHKVFFRGEVCRLLTKRFYMPFIGSSELHLKLLAERTPGSFVEFRRLVQNRFRNSRKLWWSNDHSECEPGTSSPSE